MKRHAELQDLSRDHYSALKLARDARQAAASGDAAEVERLARRVVQLFADELAPHFDLEERWLLALLGTAGEARLVERTLADHRELRRFATALETPDAPTLEQFGELLAAHVRFEEREMFEAAQACLVMRS